jgi:hypothetical protein
MHPILCFVTLVSFTRQVARPKGPKPQNTGELRGLLHLTRE